MTAGRAEHRSMSGTGEIDDEFRRESARAVASLVRVFGDIGIAEEAVQDAFVVALERWRAIWPPPART